MNIPDEAVETAQEAMYRKFNGMILPALVKVILEAAAPFIAAQAWDEGFRQGEPLARYMPVDPTRNPYRSDA